MSNKIESLKCEVAELIYAKLYVNYYQNGEHQDLEKFANDAIKAADVFTKCLIQISQNVDKDKAVLSSYKKN